MFNERSFGSSIEGVGASEFHLRPEKPRKQGERGQVRAGCKGEGRGERREGPHSFVVHASQNRAVAGHYSSARCRHTPRIQPQHHCHEIRWGSGGPTLHSDAVHAHLDASRERVDKAIAQSRTKTKRTNKPVPLKGCTRRRSPVSCPSTISVTRRMPMD